MPKGLEEPNESQLLMILGVRKEPQLRVDIAERKGHKIAKAGEA